jgi:hypothetical protein
MAQDAVRRFVPNHVKTPPPFTLPGGQEVKIQLRLVEFAEQKMPNKLPPARKEVSQPDPTGKKFVSRSEGVSYRSAAPKLDADVAVMKRPIETPIAAIKIPKSSKAENAKILAGATHVRLASPEALPEPLHPISGRQRKPQAQVRAVFSPRIPSPEIDSSQNEFAKNLKKGMSEAEAFAKATGEVGIEAETASDSVEKGVQTMSDEQLLAKIRELEEENRGLVRTVARQQREIDRLKK